jgi:membrane glycosyltransferase
MVLRRLLVVSIAAATASGLGWLLLRLLLPGGWTVAKCLMLAGFSGAAPWVGLCLANGLIGWVILMTEGVRLEPSLDVTIPSTAVAITVRNEVIGEVLTSAHRLIGDLAAAGASFPLYILSDTDDPAIVMTEETAVSEFQAKHPELVHYRRRAVNIGFKAGNIMDFLDHHAQGFELLLVLDADSYMTSRAILRLVHAMQADPTLGIVQHLAVGLPATSAFARLFQFGMRAGMRTWATAIAWWQGDECVYWGHNAILRIIPFRTHCRLPLLPDGRSILSHDQIEAALLRSAGWGVRLLPCEDGSAETNPPALPEFLRRELRWLAGNLEYRHMLHLPGLRLMGRWQLLQAILLFASTPFYLIFLIGAALAAATDPVSAFPAGPALDLTLAWTGSLYAPKLLGYMEVLLRRRQRARYGGTLRVLAGIGLETMFALQFDAVSAVSKTIAVIRLLLGGSAVWTAQNRFDRGIPWAEAFRLVWPHTLFGCAVFGSFWSAGWRLVLWAAPFTIGLLTAVPFCVLTAEHRLGAWLRRHRLAAVPEEIAKPPPAPKLNPDRLASDPL